MSEIRSLMIDFFGKKKVNTAGLDYSIATYNCTMRSVVEDGINVLKPWDDGKFRDFEVSHLTLRFFNDLKAKISGRIKHVGIFSKVLYNTKYEIDTDNTNTFTMEGGVSIDASFEKIREFSLLHNLLWKVEYDEFDRKLPVEYTISRYKFDYYLALLRYLRRDGLTEFLEDRRKATRDEDRRIARERRYGVLV